MTQKLKCYNYSIKSGRIGAIEESLDIKTAAIGAAIVETNYQAASAARCDILEYNNAGKRPVICLTLLFRDDAIQKLIAYTGSLSSSQRLLLFITNIFDLIIRTYRPGNIFAIIHHTLYFV